MNYWVKHIMQLYHPLVFELLCQTPQAQGANRQLQSQILRI